MAVRTFELKLSTQGNNDTIDITGRVQELLSESGIDEGIATVHVPGSTGGITTIEYEPGVVSDLAGILDTLIPRGENYEHDRAWGDGNAHSHMRSAFVGPSLTIPFASGNLILGTWQQIVFIDFDNRSRRRTIVVQFLGE